MIELERKCIKCCVFHFEPHMVKLEDDQFKQLRIAHCQEAEIYMFVDFLRRELECQKMNQSVYL